MMPHSDAVASLKWTLPTPRWFSIAPLLVVCAGLVECLTNFERALSRLAAKVVRLSPGWLARIRSWTFSLCGQPIGGCLRHRRAAA